MNIEDCLARRDDKLERRKLATVRRTSVRVHRQLSGLRAVFHRLERQGNDVERPLQIAAGKLAQQLDALDHDILELRERGHRLQEEVSAVMTEETNRHLHVLSILTTLLLLPPTLIAGIFGMNTKGLPFTDDETGFLWAMVLVVVSLIAVYAIMRRIGIFKTP